MPFRLDSRDCQMLLSVAEHRVLTVHHLTILQQRDTNALRRRLREVELHGLVSIEKRFSRGRRGHPEGLVSLTEDGVVALQSRGSLPLEVPSSQVTAEGFRCVDHLLLANDFRVQVVQMQRLVPALSLGFLSPTSPFLPRTADDQPAVHERFQDEGVPGAYIEFTPDGVLALTHAELGKTLLFFLEVDMGTEALTSTRSPTRDLQRKLSNYQAFFASGCYRRYEKVWNCRLQGFRLLILASSTPRMVALCRLVREFPPSDFILLADARSLESRGAWADIWVEGGRLDGPHRSILGSRMPTPPPSPGSLSRRRADEGTGSTGQGASDQTLRP